MMNKRIHALAVPLRFSALRAPFSDNADFYADLVQHPHCHSYVRSFDAMFEHEQSSLEFAVIGQLSNLSELCVDFLAEHAHGSIWLPDRFPALLRHLPSPSRLFDRSVLERDVDSQLKRLAVHEYSPGWSVPWGTLQHLECTPLGGGERLVEADELIADPKMHLQRGVLPSLRVLILNFHPFAPLSPRHDAFHRMHMIDLLRSFQNSNLRHVYLTRVEGFF
ncbi:hypothetical protein JCM11641_004653 [Rhodosporidiobolus odoratus]